MMILQPLQRTISKNVLQVPLEIFSYFKMGIISAKKHTTDVLSDLSSSVNVL